jgi:hypothetical protein
MSKITECPILMCCMSIMIGCPIFMCCMSKLIECPFFVCCMSKIIECFHDQLYNTQYMLQHSNNHIQKCKNLINDKVYEQV